MGQQSLVETQSAGNKGYSFEGQMLLIAAIVAVFLFVVLLVGIHLYARWCLRRYGAARRTRVVVLADNHRPGSAADRGLEVTVLSSLPVFHYSSKAAEQEQEQERPLLECAVCLSDFEENEIVRLLPKCNHSFHIECIDMWFHSHSTCPLCRSPVEPAENRIEPSSVVVEVAEEVSGPEPGSSSGSGLCDTCQHEEDNANVNDTSTTSLASRMKAAGGGFMGVKIEVAPPRRAEFENELTQSSPVTRLLSFKRLLSMGRKSPAVGGVSPRHVAGTSRGASELDLESGLDKPVRVYTPK